MQILEDPRPRTFLGSEEEAPAPFGKPGSRSLNLQNGGCYFGNSFVGGSRSSERCTSRGEEGLQFQQVRMHARDR